MVMVSKFSNFPNELSENDEIREYKLRGSDCIFSIFPVFFHNLFQYFYHSSGFFTSAFPVFVLQYFSRFSS